MISARQSLLDECQGDMTNRLCIRVYWGAANSMSAAISIPGWMVNRCVPVRHTADECNDFGERVFSGADLVRRWHE